MEESIFVGRHGRNGRGLRRSDAGLVRGHHNLLFCGDLARRFRLFANLYKLRLAETGFAGPLI